MRPPSLTNSASVVWRATLAERGFSCAVETVSSEIETADNAPCEAASEESPLSDGRFTVTIPADRLSPDALARLRNLIASRHRLFCDALNATELPVEERDGKIAFPWFEQTDDEEERAAYTLFIERLAELSNHLKWAASAGKDAPNEKYAMRCFLLRLGFIGAECKGARAVLLRNLQGSSAFRDGGKPSQAESEERP